MDDKTFQQLAQVVRQADRQFEKVGGSTRHWLKECLLPLMEKEGLTVMVQGELLDSGYQTVCTSGYVEHPMEISDWLAAQIGYEFKTGHTVTGIDGFEVVQSRGQFFCIAVCRVQDT